MAFAKKIDSSAGVDSFIQWDDSSMLDGTSRTNAHYWTCAMPPLSPRHQSELGSVEVEILTLETTDTNAPLSLRKHPVSQQSKPQFKKLEYIPSSVYGA